MAVTSDGAGVLRPTILVVEDDGAVRNLIQTTLDAGGFAHVSESTGRGAIAAAAMSMPDVVLLDLGLPDIDGIEVVRAIRAWSQMPIIVVSARSEDADKIGALDAGADDYLSPRSQKALPGSERLPLSFSFFRTLLLRTAGRS